AEGIPAIADRAHDLTTGPAWWVGAHLPFIGSPLDVTRGTMAAGAKMSSAIPELMQVVTQLDPANLRVNGDTVRLQPLEQAVPHWTMRRARSIRVQVTSRHCRRAPGSAWSIGA